MTRPHRLSSAQALVVLCAALTACAARGGDARSPVGVDEERSAHVARRPAPAPTPVEGWVFASVGERAIGPVASRRGAGANGAGIAAWATVAEGSGRRVIVVPIGASGAPQGGERVVANVSVDTTTLAVGPMRGPAPGFVIAWTSLTDRGKSLWTIAVGEDGAPRSKPVELTRTTDDIVWVDVIPTDRGSACLWAEETREGAANLVAAALDTEGRVRGAPTRVATGIVGWHALELPSGIGVSTIAAATPHAKGKVDTEGRSHGARPPGALSFRRLDADGHPAAPPALLTTKPVVSGDVEVALEGARLVFAWTDRSADEPSVVVAALGENDVVSPPRKIAEARGGASLLAMTSGAAGTALMFEAPTRRSGDTRRVHVAKLGADLVLERKPLSLEIARRGRPELAATSTGFAVLATTADCEPDSATCANASPVATVLRTDAHLRLVQREAMTFLGDPAALGWGLTCEGDTCFTLAASSGPPSRIRATAVRPRITTEPTVAKPEAPPADGPRIVDITALASGESVIDIAAARVGASALVAVLRAKGDAGTGDLARSGIATLAIYSSEDGAGAGSLITSKALPIGGVAIAGADKPEDGGAVAWVARENGHPEVHVTRFDRRGRRTNDIQLTTAAGDVSDVTITWAGGGWIIAWVDGRNGNGEVYATKVSPDLARIAREERITNAPGDASDLVALAHGSDVWLAWADSRESPKDGLSDVFVSAVRMRDAKRVFEEQRLLSSAAHSRTPHLASDASGVHVAWIEEAPMGSETPTMSGYGAFWTHLDAAGKLVQKPMRVPLAGDGAATSIALETSAIGGAGMRAVVARSTQETITLDAVDLSASPPRATPLLTLDGPPSLDVALVLEGGVLYFNDDGPLPSDRRARRARIAWTAP